jgi:predicted metal-dependent hydrolase
MNIDKIIRSNRRTIAIIVQKDGQVLVRAPHRISGAQIQEFVERKRGWIEDKLQQVRQKQAINAPRRFAPGETFLYLGEAFPLEISTRSSPALAFKDGCFLLARQEHANARDLLSRWYRKQARAVLSQRVQLYAERFKDRLKSDYTKIRITSARTRWGSCSSLGTLSFPYRLVMAPLSVIDYVVIHELAHLIEKNHSRRFWAQVSAMMPDYAQHVSWLKENGYRLTLD